MNTMRNICFLTKDGKSVPKSEWRTGSKRGLEWDADDGPHRLAYDFAIGVCIAPLQDAFVLDFPKWPDAPFQHPNNAAIYNADGSLRCQLIPPPALARSLPGTTLTPEQIHRMQPDGFWNVGCGRGDGIEDGETPWMWAHIGYGYDTFECRYFDPRTGKFDDEHFSVGRL